MTKLTFLLALIYPFFISAQLSVNNNLTVENYVQNVLVGTGVTITNIQYNGGSANVVREQVGSFSDPSANLGLTDGLILGTGNVQMASSLNIGDGESMGGTGNMGVDTDLASITPDDVFDECVLEFDFTPVGDTLKFNYVFASEEYDEYVCAGVNDAFGFFLTGPNPSGGNYSAFNIALVPDPTNPTQYTSTPVSVNTINSGSSGIFGTASTCSSIDPAWASYNVFYRPNTTNSYEYDGSTVVLQAKIAVVCNQTYHIKLAIGDAGDDLFDSGVFLEGGSFSSNGVEVDISAESSVNSIIGDSAILEGCTNAVFTFVRPDTIGDLSLDINILGTAINGTDYTSIPDSIYFSAGQDTATITINSIADGINEGTENITIDVYTISPCGDTIVTSGTLYIVEDYDILINAESDSVFTCPTDSVLLTATANGGIAPYTITWNTGQTGDSIYVHPSQTTQYTATATDFCNTVSIIDTVTLTYNLSPPIDIQLNDTSICSNSSLLLEAQTSGGAQPLTYQWSTGSVSPTTLVTPTSTTTYYITVTDACTTSTTDSVTINILNNPLSVSIDFNNPLCLGTDLILSPNISGGFSPYSFYWTGQGLLQVNSQNGSLTVSNPATGDYNLTINDACGQSQTISTFVDVIECQITIPNVITPNGDNYNETFVIKNLEYHPNSKIYIYNRWGKIIYKSDDYKNDWKGTNMNGKTVSGGVYYYVLDIKDKSQCDNGIACKGFITVIK